MQFISAEVGEPERLQLARELTAVLEPKNYHHRTVNIRAWSASGRPALKELTHDIIPLRFVGAHSLRLLRKAGRARMPRSAGPRARGRCRAIPVGRFVQAGGQSGASFSSRTRRRFHKPGRSDSDVRCHRCAATRSGACNLGGEETLAISRFHLISVLPLIEPTGEKGFVLVVQQALQSGQ